MQGHFGIGDFGTYLGNLSGQAEMAGMSGPRANVVLASALEAIQEYTNESGETDTDLKNFFEYLREPMAQREFDPTPRTLKMDSVAGRRLRHEYHLPNLDLNAYLGAEWKKGVDPIDATLDFFDKYLEDVKNPIDVGDIMGMYFHNQTAAQAFFPLFEQQQIFHSMQASLSRVSDDTLAADFNTSTANGSGTGRWFDEERAQWFRWLGRDVDWEALEPLRGVLTDPVGSVLTGLNPFATPLDLTARNNPAPIPLSGQQAPIQLSPQIPITVNVLIDRQGNVSVTGGITGAPATAPGTNVRVNQGTVLGGLHY